MAALADALQLRLTATASHSILYWPGLLFSPAFCFGRVLLDGCRGTSWLRFPLEQEAKKKFISFFFFLFHKTNLKIKIQGFHFIRGLVKFMNFLVKLHEVCRVSRTSLRS
jgi:hypothetical protein